MYLLQYIGDNISRSHEFKFRYTDLNRNYLRFDNGKLDDRGPHKMSDGNLIVGDV